MHSEADVREAIRSYVMVFVALMVFTVITVAVAELQLSMPISIALALLIATIKGAMVAGVFMHLSNETKLIYGTLILTVILFIGLVVWPTIGHFDRPSF